MPKYTVEVIEMKRTAVTFNAADDEKAKQEMNKQFTGEGQATLSLANDQYKTPIARIHRTPEAFNQFEGKFTTYHSSRFESLHGSKSVLDEYDAPYVPFHIHTDRGCIDIEMGKGDPANDKGDQTVLMVERQTDRYMITVQREAEGDPAVMIYVMDNGAIVGAENSPHDPDIDVGEKDAPGPLPWSEVKFKELYPSPALQTIVANPNQYDGDPK